MPEESFQEKTEAPTARRREDARKRGQVARSMEINSVAILLVGLLTLRVFGPTLFASLADFMRFAVRDAAHIDLNADNAAICVRHGMQALGMLLLPVAAVLAATGLAVNFAQVGFYVSAEPMTPKLDKLNPLSGLKRLFAMKSLVNLAVSLAKIAIIALVCYVSMRRMLGETVFLSDQSPRDILCFITGHAFTIALRVCLVLIVIAALDYGYQRWEHEKGIRMTKQELKEELKQYEGDPMVRSRIRGIQRQMAMKRMMAEVPKADVVITNPVHLAIAIRYEAGAMNAPTVVAKGARLVAEKIKKIAAENGVPVMENKPLAQAMYKGVKVGQEIPQEFYRALAEVLAYVYRLGRKTVPETAAS